MEAEPLQSEAPLDVETQMPQQTATNTEAEPPQSEATRVAETQMPEQTTANMEAEPPQSEVSREAETQMPQQTTANIAAEPPQSEAPCLAEKHAPQSEALCFVEKLTKMEALMKALPFSNDGGELPAPAADSAPEVPQNMVVVHSEANMAPSSAERSGQRPGKCTASKKSAKPKHKNKAEAASEPADNASAALQSSQSKKQAAKEPKARGGMTATALEPAGASQAKPHSKPGTPSSASSSKACVQPDPDQSLAPLFLSNKTKGMPVASSTIKQQFLECELIMQTIVLKKFRMAARQGNAEQHLGVCGLGTIKQYKQERPTIKGLVMGGPEKLDDVWMHAEKQMPEGLGLVLLCDNSQVDLDAAA